MLIVSEKKSPQNQRKSYLKSGTGAYGWKSQIVRLYFAHWITFFNLLFFNLLWRNSSETFSEQIYFTLPFTMYHTCTWVAPIVFPHKKLALAAKWRYTGWHAVKSMRRFTAYVFDPLFAHNKSVKHCHQHRKMACVHVVCVYIHVHIYMYM